MDPLAALIEEELTPGAKVTSDDEILAHIRRDGGTVYHPCGTARMGEDAQAPVDSRLRSHVRFGEVRDLAAGK